MTQARNPEDNLPQKPSLLYRVCKWLERRERLPGLRANLVRFVRVRLVHPWEWCGSLDADETTIELRFTAPRIPTQIRLEFEQALSDKTIKVSVPGPGGWSVERVWTSWKDFADKSTVTISFDRLVVTPSVRVHVNGLSGKSGSAYIIVAREEYWDAEHISIALAAIDEENSVSADEHLRKCMEAWPAHFAAAHGLARLSADEGRWPDCRHWAATAYAHSAGTTGSDLLLRGCNEGIGDLTTETARLKGESETWDLGGHHGVVCLLNHQHFALGYRFFQLVRTRRILEIRRQAAARLLRHLSFEYSADKDNLVSAKLRILHTNGDVHAVSNEHLTIMDDPESNPAIRTEDRKRVLFHLPELNRGDCLELEYYLFRRSTSASDDRPEVFIAVDHNCEFPSWESIVEIQAPRDWDLQCIGINGAPEPILVDGCDSRKTFVGAARELYFDDWGTYDLERRYRSPHVCCSWANRTWKEVGEFSRDTLCHAPRDEPVPDVLRRIMSDAGGAREKLRLGFEWIRDQLKYMSLHSAKARSSDPDLGAKIVAAGVADCMDRAYLIIQICHSLRIEADYLVTASESGHVVEELPAQQFDHILVRARIDGEWLYLDATDTSTPFSWIPLSLQGQLVLSLGSEPGLLRVPEEAPEKNVVRISETLALQPDSELTGEFSMEAIGLPARWLDEEWKGGSLTADDPKRAASLTLRKQLPSAELQDWTIQPLAPGMASFGLTGTHYRPRPMQIDGDRIGFVSWDTPLFPIYRARERKWDGMAVFPMPLTYEIVFRMTAPEGWRVSGRSVERQFETAFGSIQTESSVDATRVTRIIRLQIKCKFIDPKYAESISEFLREWEEALRMAFVLKESKGG